MRLRARETSILTNEKNIQIFFIKIPIEKFIFRICMYDNILTRWTEMNLF